MGQSVSSALQPKSITYTAANNDVITILMNPMCEKEGPRSCKHHVNIKRFDQSDYNNEIMTGYQIYEWFESRNSQIPPHFLYTKEWSMGAHNKHLSKPKIKKQRSSLIDSYSGTLPLAPVGFNLQYSNSSFGNLKLIH
eukprot:132079_1